MLPSYDMVVSEIDDANATSDVQGAIMIATRYLSERGFENMTANFTQRNEGVIVINFACLQEGVTLYPDLVKVQVSGGRVVGWRPAITGAITSSATCPRSRSAISRRWRRSIRGSISSARGWR